MMETSDLIKALSADAGRREVSFGSMWTGALALAVAVAATVFFVSLGPRVDIAAAAETTRFLFKFVVTCMLVVTAVPALLTLARPEGVTPGRLIPLIAAPLLLTAALLLEMVAVPASDWGTRLVGVNMPYCLTYIPLIGLGPLALFILALRRAAPGRPQLAGAVAGLAAGGIAATLYAAHCTDDSPLFVATWYTTAIAMLTALGALAGRAFARW
jgi:hypothetical protein